MELTVKQRAILNGARCPYCGSETKAVSEEFIYGRKYRGRTMICCSRYPSCDSYCGTHDDGTSLGRLANKQLRFWKKEAHSAFDPIWKEKYKERTEAYEWLADELELPDSYTHIGYFGIKTCKKVIDICNKFMNEQRNR